MRDRHRKRYSPLLVLDLTLDSLNTVRGLNLKGDRLASQSLDEDLHSAAGTEDKVKVDSF